MKYASRNPYPREWRVLYRAAIYEQDTCKIPKRLSDAELAIVERTRELFRENGAEIEGEREALDDAMYALRAPRVALEQGTRAA